MHMLLYAFIVDIIYVRTVLGLDIERRYQVDLIDGLHLLNTTYDGLTTVTGVHSFSPAISLQGENRNLRLSEEVFERATKLLSKGNEFTLLATLQQEERNAGTILSFSEGNNRYLELQSSGRKDEIRLHYSHRDSVYMETFPYRLADGRWHRLALTISGNHVSLLVDCNRIYERSIRDVDRDFAGRNLSLWLGQRNGRHFLFKGSLQDVKIVGKEHGYVMQCPHLDTECPTCGQFRHLQMSLLSLESHIKELTERLAEAERRITAVEECDCRRSCNVNGSLRVDGATWPQGCDICTCVKGEIQCHPVQCPPAPCKNPIRTPGECCPTCLKHCLMKGVVYDHGEEVSIRQCVDCACHDGSMLCHKVDPEIMCPKLQCPEHEQFSVPGECCKFCPGVDYCAKGHSCHANATCVNLQTRFACQCNPGFSGDGKHCGDVNECAKPGGHDGHYCHSNTQCINTPGSYVCECLPGYTRVDAFNCAEHDECSSGDHQCHKNALCTNTQGGYHCQCLTGYEGDGFTCEPLCNQSCLNGGKCVAPGICACRRGYVGPSCDIDVDECTLGIHQCHPNSRCVNMPGWYYCECQNGYQSLLQDNNLGVLCQDVDECSLDRHSCPKTAQCVNSQGSYSCQCINSTSCSLDCMYEGSERKNGSFWTPTDKTCTQCICLNGKVTCDPIPCNCTDNNVDLNCCPQCDRTSSCLHQELPTVYQNGQRWIYQCQICECLYGEVDCWDMECPPLTCDNPIRVDGDCCLRCEDDPCATDLAEGNQTLQANERGCTYLGQLYSSGEQWQAIHDHCTTCKCKNGHLCCSYSAKCVHNRSHASEHMDNEGQDLDTNSSSNSTTGKQQTTPANNVTHATSTETIGTATSVAVHISSSTQPMSPSSSVPTPEPLNKTGLENSTRPNVSLHEG